MGLTYDGDPKLVALLRSIDPRGDLDAAHDAWIELYGRQQAVYAGELVNRARFRVQDYWRKESRQKLRPIDGNALRLPSAHSTELTVIEMDSCERVRVEVRQLPKRYREVVEKHFFEQATIPEIARDLQISPKGVYTRLERAYAKLGQRLEQFRGGLT